MTVACGRSIRDDGYQPAPNFQYPEGAGSGYGEIPGWTASPINCVRWIA